MLDRVLEPEVMDTEEDAHDYETIDNESVNADFVAQALELAPSHGRVIDIGTGPGHIAILLARRAPGLSVVAVDLGEHMLALARKNAAAAGLGERLRVVRADAKATGFDDGSFDMVVSNSLAHHNPEPRAFFAEVMRLVRPEGGLLIKDLHRPTSEAEHHRLVERYAGDCTARQRQLFSDSLHAALTVSEVAALCAAAGLASVNVRRCSDRHWCVERRASARG